jgi:hypothetical protein
MQRAAVVGMSLDRLYIDYQPTEALKLACCARDSNSHFEFPTRDAGDLLSPIDPKVS